MKWLTKIFRRSNGEKRADAVENNVERLEDQAVDQQIRLDAAVKRVSRAAQEVRRVEDLARKRNAS